MEQRSNDAVKKGARLLLKKEECALSMEQRGNFAAAKGAQIKSSKEEYALGMEQRSNYAALMDARIKSSKEEYALGMEQTALQTTNLLLLDQNSIRLLLRIVTQLVPAIQTKEVLVFLETLLFVKVSQNCSLHE